MSQISLKSISGITSITTPSGVDNQLTVHTSDTTQRLKVTQSGIDVTGIVTANSISGGSSVTATTFYGSGSNLTGLASREVYGFTGIGKSLSLTTTNSGADNIDNATYVAFEESFIGPSGLSFSINTSGNLIMTV